MKGIPTTVNNQKGFTLIEIIAVLVLLGILAAVAVPKYMNMAEEARAKAAQGQIAEVKGRLSQSEAKFMLKNSGTKPTAAELLTEIGEENCPTVATTEGDFEFVCAANAGGDGVDITVSVVQGTALATAITDTYKIIQ